jgi:hypothetical protein
MKSKCYIRYFNNKEWVLKEWMIVPKGTYHRENGPAVIYATGQMYWYLYGGLKRKEWFIENPHMISKMKAWTLFTPDEIVKIKTNELYSSK